MGLAVSRHLASQGWKISIADLNVQSGEAVAKELDGLFTKVDVTKYEDQAAAFQKTWEKFGQIDFGTFFELTERLSLAKLTERIVYANAGIIDTIPWYGEQNSLPPPKPSLPTQDVCLTGVEYSSYLAMHYMRQNKVKGGSLIMTSSGERLIQFSSKFPSQRCHKLIEKPCSRRNLSFLPHSHLHGCKAWSCRLHASHGAYPC